jgi:hypothetical protein
MEMLEAESQRRRRAKSEPFQLRLTNEKCRSVAIINTYDLSGEPTLAEKYAENALLLHASRSYIPFYAEDL